MILLDAGVRDPLPKEAALVQGEVELVARVLMPYTRLSNCFLYLAFVFVFVSVFAFVSVFVLFLCFKPIVENKMFTEYQKTNLDQAP